MSRARSGRGQTELLGLVLLIGITLAGVTAILVLGSSALEGHQRASGIDRAEHAMTQFDSQASLVALGATDHQRATVPTGDVGTSLRVDEDAGWMNVTVYNDTTGSVETVVMNATMGAVVYENRDTTIAYQGGGVWKRTGAGSTMVSPPEFHYRLTGSGNPTLTLPLVVVDGAGTVDGAIRVKRNGSTASKYPVVDDRNRSNPLDSGEVNVTVHSEYYEAWGEFFEERTGGSVTYDDARDRVTIVLEVPIDQETLDGAVTSTVSAGGDDAFSISGGGSFGAFTDSYNSSVGPYPESRSFNGTVKVAGSVTVGGNAEINGSVRSGDEVSLDASTSVVNGTVYWTTGFSAHRHATYDDDEQIDGVGTAGSIESVVEDEVDDRSSSDNNDNGNTTDIQSNQLQFGGSPITLDPGEYYLSSVAMNGQKLILNLPDEDDETVIAVDGGFKLENDANITVDGDGTARIYTVGKVEIKSGSVTKVPGNRSRGLWVYATDHGHEIKGSQSDAPSFVGVLYAPTDSGGSQSSVEVKHAEVYGGLVAGTVDVNTGGAVHFDHALRADQPLPNNPSVPRITYLHVSISRVTVTD